MNRSVTAFLVLALVFGFSVSATGEVIEVGGEVHLLEDGPGGGLQRMPAVAYGNGIYLVVWQEGWEGEGGKARIFATRISPSGRVLDAKGIEVAPHTTGVQGRPRVAFGGGVFLLTWQDMRNGKDNDVLAARISPKGKVLDKKAITIAGAPGTQALPDVASNGESFVVVWQGAVQEDEGLTYYSFARSVSAAGALGAPNRACNWPNPGVAWGGKSYLLVVSQMRGLVLSRSGRPTDNGEFSVIRHPGIRYKHFSVAGCPRGWLVVADRSQPDYWGWGGPGAMRCILVKPDGSGDESLEPILKRDRAGNWSKLPNWLDVGGRERKTWPYGRSAVAWDGKQYVAVWQRHHIEKAVMFKNCDLIASRVEGWKPLDDAGVPIADSDLEEQWPALASDDAGRLLCVYEKHSADGSVRVVARPLKTY